MLTRKLLHHAIALILVVVLGGFLSATMVRLAPGHNSGEELLDPHLSPASRQALAQARNADQSALQFYLQFTRRLLHGELGSSQSLGRPIAELIRDRAPVTARLVLLGLLIGWSAALAFVLIAIAFRAHAGDLATIAISGGLLSVPTAVLALLSVMWNVAGSLAIGLVVFPRVHRYAWNLLESAYARPHIVMARAKGLGGRRILLFHIVPVVGPQLLAVLGISISLAVGAAIPIEALCGIAGIGQLAWQAALSRDIPVIVHITSLVALLTVMANSLADIAASATRNPSA